MTPIRLIFVPLFVLVAVLQLHSVTANPYGVDSSQSNLNSQQNPDKTKLLSQLLADTQKELTNTAHKIKDSSNVDTNKTGDNKNDSKKQDVDSDEFNDSDEKKHHKGSPYGQRGPPPPHGQKGPPHGQNPFELYQKQYQQHAQNKQQNQHQQENKNESEQKSNQGGNTDQKQQTNDTQSQQSGSSGASSSSQQSTQSPTDQQSNSSQQSSSSSSQQQQQQSKKPLTSIKAQDSVKANEPTEASNLDELIKQLSEERQKSSTTAKPNGSSSSSAPAKLRSHSDSGEKCEEKSKGALNSFRGGSGNFQGGHGFYYTPYGPEAFDFRAENFDEDRLEESGFRVGGFNEEDDDQESFGYQGYQGANYNGESYGAEYGYRSGDAYPESYGYTNENYNYEAGAYPESYGYRSENFNEDAYPESYGYHNENYNQDAYPAEYGYRNSYLEEDSYPESYNFRGETGYEDYEQHHSAPAYEPTPSYAPPQQYAPSYKSYEDEEDFYSPQHIEHINFDEFPQVNSFFRASGYDEEDDEAFSWDDSPLLTSSCGCPYGDNRRRRHAPLVSLPDPLKLNLQPVSLEIPEFLKVKSLAKMAEKFQRYREEKAEKRELKTDAPKKIVAKEVVAKDPVPQMSTFEDDDSPLPDKFFVTREVANLPKINLKTLFGEKDDETLSP